MVGLRPVPKNWEDAIHGAAIQFMNAEVCFYRVIEGTDDYPEINQPGTPGGVEVTWRGKARVQHLRAPRADSTEYQASDSRSFRFQLDPRDNPPQLYSGNLARVIDGGRDASLLTYSFVVDSAVNSSHMSVRTVELTSDMRPMDWRWDPDG